MADPITFEQAKTDVLGLIKDARTELTKLRRQKNLTPDEMDELDTASTELDDAEDTIRVENLSNEIKAIKKTASNLGKICEEMKKSAAKLQSLAKKIDLTAKAIGVLAQIAGKASSAGIL